MHNETRGLSKTSQNAKVEHFDDFIFGQNYTNQNVAGMLQKGNVEANTAVRTRSAIIFFVTLTSNVKFLKFGGTILASPTAKLRGARPTAKLRGLSKTPQNTKFEHFEHFISGPNGTIAEIKMQPGCFRKARNMPILRLGPV